MQHTEAMSWSEFNETLTAADATRESLVELLRVKDEPWRRHAACRGVDPEFFFPPRGTPSHEVDEIRALCARCVVRVECADAAIANRDNSGIRGGLSGRERRQIIHAQTVAVAAAH